jgi:hypothetical protein
MSAAMIDTIRRVLHRKQEPVTEFHLEDMAPLDNGYEVDMIERLTLKQAWEKTSPRDRRVLAGGDEGLTKGRRSQIRRAFRQTLLLGVALLCLSGMGWAQDLTAKELTYLETHCAPFIVTPGPKGYLERLDPAKMTQKQKVQHAKLMAGKKALYLKHKEAGTLNEFFRNRHPMK